MDCKRRAFLKSGGTGLNFIRTPHLSSSVRASSLYSTHTVPEARLKDNDTTSMAERTWRNDCSLAGGRPAGLVVIRCVFELSCGRLVLTLLFFVRRD